MGKRMHAARSRGWWLAGAGVLVAVGVAPIVAIMTAPSVEATCTHVLELVAVPPTKAGQATAGESIGEPEREACTRRFSEIRRERGVLRWAKISWCTRLADTVDEAGEC